MDRPMNTASRDSGGRDAAAGVSPCAKLTPIMYHEVYVVPTSARKANSLRRDCEQHMQHAAAGTSDRGSARHACMQARSRRDLMLRKDGMNTIAVATAPKMNV